MEISINYYDDNRLFHSKQFNQSKTVEEFLHDIFSEDSRDRRFKSAYLKGRKLNKNERLETLIDDLCYYAIFITIDPTKQLILNPSPIDLNDYQNIQQIPNSSHHFIAVNQRTNQEVIISSSQSSLEAYIAHQIQLPGVSKIIGHYFFTGNIPDNFNFESIRCLPNIVFMEYFQNGNIEQHVKAYLDSNGTNSLLTPTVRSKIIFGVAATMKQIQNKNIILNNLYLNKVFLDNSLEPKISNFSRAKFAISTQYNSLAQPLDSECMYMAPEIFMDNDYYDTQADVYSFAIFIMKMFTKTPRLNQERQPNGRPQLMMCISRGIRYVRPENMPDAYWDLVNDCWNEDPTVRPTFEQITERLKDDRFALNEFGHQTDLDQLHEYQRRIDKEFSEINNLRQEVAQLKETIRQLRQRNDDMNENYRMQIIGSEEFHEFRQIREISSGGGGRVYEVCRDEKFAMKVMHMRENSFTDLQGFIFEYECLQRLNHPNIIKTFGIFLSDETHPPSIILELCERDLSSAIRSGSNVEIVFWIYQTAEAMKYVHHCNIVHRDLKPSNLLIGKDGKVRLTDFGISKIMTSEDQSTTMGAGTQRYMAPEILVNNRYSKKSDVYSFGVFLYFMLNRGNLPNFILANVFNGVKPPIPRTFTLFAHDLINICWNNTPEERPSFESILTMLDRNDYKLFDFTVQEVAEIRTLVQQHALLIPSY